MTIESKNYYEVKADEGKQLTLLSADSRLFVLSVYTKNPEEWEEWTNEEVEEYKKQHPIEE